MERGADGRQQLADIVREIGQGLLQASAGIFWPCCDLLGVLVVLVEQPFAELVEIQKAYLALLQCLVELLSCAPGGFGELAHGTWKPLTDLPAQFFCGHLAFRENLACGQQDAI